jgi:hypothetical protein
MGDQDQPSSLWNAGRVHWRDLAGAATLFAICLCVSFIFGEGRIGWAGAVSSSAAIAVGVLIGRRIRAARRRSSAHVRR